jgi:hypothetical protein
MSDFVEQSIHRRQPALVLASRSDKSFRKYPPMQRHTEGVINDLCGQTVKAGAATLRAVHLSANAPAAHAAVTRRNRVGMASLRLSPSASARTT